MNSVMIAPVLGLGLGTWLLVAGVRKMIDPSHFQMVVARLSGGRASYLMVHTTSRIVPWCEVTLAIAASVLFDSAIVRGAVLGLFVLFLFAVVVLALKNQRFDCGCLGARGSEHRLVVVGRTAGGVTAASIWFLAPISHQSMSAGMLLVLAGTWSAVLLFAVVVHAWEWIHLPQEGEYS